MGSTGSGKFTDYSGTKPTASDSSSSGGASGVDHCQQAFSTHLEEVAQCQYYNKHSSVPKKDDELSITKANGRICAIDSQGDTVGALPTKYNYLLACLEDGHSYVGIVNSSYITGNNPSVSADFTPQ